MINYSIPPAISCLLVTAAGRFDYVKRSINCYIDQTYPYRELLILNEGPTTYQAQIQEYVDALKRPDIRYVWLDGKYTLGALRNISVALSHHPLVCQWDDDDFCMPTRLSAQAAHLLSDPDTKVCYLSDQLHYYFHTKELFWDNWVYRSGNRKKYMLIPGTLLAWKEFLPKYPTVGKFCSAGEDSVVSDTLIDTFGHDVKVIGGLGHLHMYTYHGTNQVYGIDHHSIISMVRGHKRDHIIQHRTEIVKFLDYINISDEINVKSDDNSLVFKYNKQ